MQGDGGWNTPDMVTKRYAHTLDEDRCSLAAEMETKFYQGSGAVNPISIPASEAPQIDANEIATLIANNPDLLTQILQSVQTANNA